MAYYRSKSSNGRAKEVFYNGHLFPSITEYEVYLQLEQLELAGQISNLVLQPKFTLFPKLDVEIINKLAGWGANQEMVYTPDMMYFDHRRQRNTVIEAKGHFRVDAKLRIRIWLQLYLKDYDFIIITKHKNQLDWHYYYYQEPKRSKKK